MHTDVETPKHRKKRPTKKPYAIEWRWGTMFDWRTWKRYETAEKRDQALTTLQRSRSEYSAAEFRAKP